MCVASHRIASTPLAAKAAYLRLAIFLLLIDVQGRAAGQLAGGGCREKKTHLEFYRTCQQTNTGTRVMTSTVALTVVRSALFVPKAHSDHSGLYLPTYLLYTAVANVSLRRQRVRFLNLAALRLWVDWAISSWGLRINQVQPHSYCHYIASTPGESCQTT